MNNYQDRWSRFHDKPCEDGFPSSNNGWIYSAYSRKLGLDMDTESLRMCWMMCHAPYPVLGCAFDRSPGKQEPPSSRDEVLGLYYLGLLKIQALLFNNWNYSPYPIPSFNIFKILGALWRMKDAHRNELWANGGEPHLFRFAFSVPIQDRAFMLRHSKIKVPLSYRLFEWISAKVSKKSDSSDLIEWLKSGDKPDPALFARYFGNDHPFTIACERFGMI